MASVADPDLVGSEPFFYRFGQKWTGSNIEVNRVECFEGASNCHTKTLLNNFFCQIDQCNVILKRKEKIRDFYVVKYQCCGAGAGGAEIIWNLKPEPKLNF